MRTAALGILILSVGAVVQARGEFVRPDGTTGTSRYTDVWALQDGKWKTVSAQITRIQVPPK